MVGNLCGPVVIPTAKPRLSLYCCLCLIISEDGLLLTPKLILATRTHPPLHPRHTPTNLARAHTHFARNSVPYTWGQGAGRTGPCKVLRSSWPGLACFYSSGSGPGESRSGWGRGGGKQAPLQQQPHTGCRALVVAGGDGGGEKVPHPVFSRGQCKGVQSGPGPQLLTLDRWEAGGRAVDSLLEDGVGVGTGVLTMI